MDILDRHDKKVFYIVMDNCRIHHSHYVIEAIQSRGHKPLFMPLNHHFLTLLKSAGLKLKRMSKETHHSPH
jgi:hypothetical protein